MSSEKKALKLFSSLKRNARNVRKKENVKKPSRKNVKQRSKPQQQQQQQLQKASLPQLLSSLMKKLNDFRKNWSQKIKCRNLIVFRLFSLFD